MATIAPAPVATSAPIFPAALGATTLAAPTITAGTYVIPAPTYASGVLLQTPSPYEYAVDPFPFRTPWVGGATHEARAFPRLPVPVAYDNFTRQEPFVSTFMAPASVYDPKYYAQWK